MKTPLTNIPILSIYPVDNPQKVPLPAKMARCTPDTYNAIKALEADLKNKGGKLILSDLFRSYDMQLQAHLDYTSGKKKAYSPPPGGSMHEAGRAMDIDLSKIGVPLSEFWTMAEVHGFYPIINTPDSKLKEAWHFDRRGSHHIVYEYYQNGNAHNMSPYTAMSVSGILSIGVSVDRFKGKEDAAFIQSGLIRLGYNIGPIDGNIGHKTNTAIMQEGLDPLCQNLVMEIENRLQIKFPEEYSVPAAENLDQNKPVYII